MMNQNKEEHKYKSVRNRSKGSARLHSSSNSNSSSSSSNSSNSSNTSDNKHSLQEDKKIKAKLQQPKN
eukprot:2096619-Ditylum_brightwellii.AAC.1